MHKFITAITTAIALTACGGNSKSNDVSENEQLPLTYRFDEKEPNSYIGFNGNIVFDKGCFYSEFLGDRMAVVFPDSFKWDKSSNIIKANSRTITSDQKIVGGAVIVDREAFAKSKGNFIANESCLTKKLVLLHSYFS